MNTVYLIIAVCLTLPSCICEDRNVGTVLFTKIDASKRCWSDENVALLTSRMVLEDLLPSRKIFAHIDDYIVGSVLEYFHMVLALIKNNTEGLTKHIMLRASADLIGGYLKHLVLPEAKHAFYIGYINFESLLKLYNLYDEIKLYLHTDGKTWKDATANYRTVTAPEPIRIPDPGSHSHACDGLYIHLGKRDKNRIAVTVDIQLPFFDSKIDPMAIAVPYKSSSLRNLQSKEAAYILIKYFIMCTNCMKAMNANDLSVKRFNGQFYKWILQEVVPLLQNEKYYSAFGSVYRLLETLRNLGADISHANEPNGGYDILSKSVESENEEENEKNEYLCNKQKEPIFSKFKDPKFLVVLCLLLLLCMLLLLNIIYVCCRRASRCQQKNPETSKYSRNLRGGSTSSSMKSPKSQPVRPNILNSIKFDETEIIHFSKMVNEARSDSERRSEYTTEDETSSGSSEAAITKSCDSSQKFRTPKTKTDERKCVMLFERTENVTPGASNFCGLNVESEFGKSHSIYDFETSEFSDPVTDETDGYSRRAASH